MFGFKIFTSYNNLMKIFELLKNKYFQSYVAIYILSIVLLNTFEDYAVSEIIGIVLILGVIFPSIAFWVCISSSPLLVKRDHRSSQIIAAIICILIVSVYLTLGTAFIADLVVEDVHSLGHETITLISKLFFFVIIPAFIFIKVYGYTLKDFGIELNFKKWQSNKHFLVLFIIVPIMILFQFFVGQAAAPIRNGEYSFIQILTYLPFVFLWLLLEVGLVEEFFFRSLLQTQISVFLKSEIGGILMSALIFGLAHAPGLFLRGAGVDSPVGSSPSILMSVGYSIVVLSAAGIFLGVIWSRTRNLLLCMIIHASVDLLTNFDSLYKILTI